jgi:PAS domain S-box-containing protein
LPVQLEKEGANAKPMTSTETETEESFYAGQTRILEMVASDAPLPEILKSIVLLMEKQAEGLVCSILVLSADGIHVQHGAAPSLPEAYVNAVNGAPIGPRNGSCGTAMFLRKPVVVTDVLTDPLWADYRDLAKICGLRACWSTPILSAQNEVLGSFAMYRQEMRGPNAEELHLTQVATHITGIAIGRKRAEEALHHSEEQLSLLQTITMEVATAKDLSSALEVVLQRVCEKTGWDFGQSWLPRRDGTLLELGPVWMGSVAELEKFRAASKQRNFAPGEGLPGRVWIAKQPLWLYDIRSDPNFPRAKIATECGLKAALAIPILARDEVIAVIEFFLRAPRHEDARLVNVITAVAAQLGLAIERKRAEEAVREREAQISVAAESADLAFWVVYPEQNAVWMSEKGRKIYGFHPQEILTRDSLVKRAHPDDRASVESVFDRACGNFEAFESEHRLVLPFGKRHWVIMRGRCFKDEEGNLAEIIGVTIDVSAQKQSALQMQTQREEMAHLNRVALMGEMTASVAHELNQPLTAIANNAAAARRFLERGNIDPALLKELLQDMVADSQRAGEVIRGIRALVRKEKGVRSVLNVNAIIADTLRLVGSDVVLRESVITTELDQSLPQVEAVPVQIQQVLINLIMNALDAVEKLPPSERRIVVSTRTDEDGLAEVSVRDFGHGLPKDRPEKVFDHFFSTKQAGMGMGLTIVRSIIESHGGTISAENASDRGARFFVRLPAARKDQQSQAA